MFWPAQQTDPRALAAAEQQALATLAQPRFQPPQGWTWHRFANQEGAHLRYGSSQTSQSVHGTIVILPGFQAPIEEFFETAHDYLARGFDVWSLDMRGQGGSDRWLGNPQKAYSGGTERDERDLVQFIATFVRPKARGPVFIVAQSLGGHVALRALHDHPGLADALVLSSPAIAFNAASLSQRLPPWVLRLAADWAVNLGFGSAYAIHASDWEFFADAGGATDRVKDDRARALAGQAWLLKNPALREGGMTWAFMNERFRSSALVLSPGWMRSVAVPVLIGTARDDAMTDVASIAASCRAMQHCELLSFPRAKHALFGDTDSVRTPFVDASVQFLLRQPREEARR